MEQVKMKRDEVVHEIEEDLEVVQTIEKGEGQVIEDIDDDEVGRETEGDGEVEIEEGAEDQGVNIVVEVEIVTEEVLVQECPIDLSQMSTRKGMNP